MTPSEILRFFDKEIEPAQFALYLRRYNHAVMHNMLEGIKQGHEMQLTHEIANGVYWANELAETIDPYLDKDC